MRRWLSVVVMAACGGYPLASPAADDSFGLKLRSLVGEGDEAIYRYELARWPAEKTAVIVCDVWDLHHCLNAVRRLEEFAPRLNRFVAEARRRGAVIIHAPSDCMDAYAQHPARKRALTTPRAEPLPAEIECWCLRIPAEEQAQYPIDQSDGGEDDDPAEHQRWAENLRQRGRNPNMPWKKQSDLIQIDPQRDYISDRGDEVWSILQARGVKQVMLTGVHANMCVLGRPFGLRQMVRNGMQTVLVRDLTDSMYNPQRWPYVDHFTGNDLVIAHIERYVCPTITSDQLLGGEPFRWKDDTRPRGDRGNPPQVPRRRDHRKSWSVAAVPADWKAATDGALEDYTGVAWYRCTVRVPESWRDASGLALELPAAVRGRAWLNGKPMAEADSGKTRRLQAAADTVLYDDANLLVLRMEHRGKDPLVPPVLSAAGNRLKLAGRWQIRLGDDAAWSDMPLPARFGTSTDVVFQP